VREWDVKTRYDHFRLPEINGGRMNADLFFEGLLSYEFVSSHSEKMPVLHAQGLSGAEFVELTNVTGCIYKYLSDDENGWEEGDFNVFLTQDPFSVELMLGSFAAEASPPAPPESQTEEPEAK
jgi:hypothetical protein